MKKLKNTTTARTASFGPYALDLRSGELRKFGVRVKMGEQPFQILLMLLENPGEMVSREELRTKLWVDDTFVDFDHGLNSAVQRLRDCLSDTAEKPLWVETIPRRGYRFIGQVEWSNGAPRFPQNGDNDAKQDVFAPDGVTEAAPSVKVSSHGRGPRRKSRSVALGILALAAAVVLAVSLIRLAARRKTASHEGAVSIRSIAVLPLENLSGDAAEDYFADGMTDELITTLAKNHALRITSRTSIMRYKTSHQPISEIAGDLGVDGIIVGSVSRSGTRLRVNAQLIRASDDSHLWSESYERDLGDVLSLQDELARAIAEQVRVTSALSNSPRASAAARFNPQAHDAYLRGRYFWFKGDLTKSREFFQQAIDLDPAYAPGYTGLADTYAVLCVEGEMPAKEGFPKAEAAVRKALEIDDSLAAAHNTLAAVKFFYHWDWSGAENECKRAIELDPSYAEPHHLYDYILSTSNRFAEAMQQARIAQELDPFARPFGIGFNLYRQRRFEEAIKEYRSQLPDGDVDLDLHDDIANALYCEGMPKEAITEYEKALTVQGDPEGAAALENAYKSGGYRAAMEWRLERLKKHAKDHYVSPIEMAALSASLERQDDAIHYLQLAFDQHAPRLVFLKQNPFFDSLHSDSRYQAIVKNAGLP